MERALTLLLAAALAHEAGHLLVFRLLGCPVRALKWEGRGLCLVCGAPETPLEDCLAALAGPAAGLVYALGAARLARSLWPDWLYLTAGCSLLLSLFNLLPMAPLDGGRILQALAGRFLGEVRAARLCRAAGLLCLLLIGGAGLWLAARGYGLSLAAAALWLLPEQRLRQHPA